MKTKGMKQQLRALDAMQGKRNFGLFMEQGTGKTWTTLADAERCFIENKIDAVVVFAPKGVHKNWTLREIPKHLETPCVSFAWNGPVKTKRQKEGMAKLYTPADRFSVPTIRVLSINFEALITPQGFEVVREFVNSFRTMAVVDESKKIGNPKSKRTIKAIELGRPATARRILSGRPLTKAPMDLFSQFDFLKEGLLGTTSYRAFVAEYAVLLDVQHPQMQAMIRKIGPKAAFAQVVETDKATGRKKYKNLDRLNQMIAPHVFRVRKADCLDLPPKSYKKVRFDMSEKQQAIYDELKNDLSYVSDTQGPQSFEAIAVRTKMKQCTSGFVTVNGTPELMAPEDNARMQAFIDVIDDLPEDANFLVWAIYREEIAQIVAALKEQGFTATEYHGGVSDKPIRTDPQNRSQRDINVDDFQEGKYNAFVCNKAAYAGLTLTKATYSIYYSCDFDNDIRSQSEDRNHRIGTTGNVLYIDLIANGTIDEDVEDSLAFKDHLSDVVIDGAASV
jgi:SNF2 family DNA or RNA helicase